MTAIGNLEILNQGKLAIFCSTRWPPEVTLQTHELSQKFVDAVVTVIGGFHSPLERECLRILLQGNQPVIICPARSLTKMRIRTDYKEPLEKGRLLFLSFFRSHRHRSDVGMALRRNRFVAAIADRIVILYAAPASKTERFCHEIIAWRKPLFTIESHFNQHLMAAGAKPLNSSELGNWSHG